MINTERNVKLQITFPKEDFANLENFLKALHQKGVIVTKSDILLESFRTFLNSLLKISQNNKNTQGEKEND